MSNPTVLKIAHFNDVYQASEQAVVIDGKTEKIDVSKFAASLESVTSKWETRSDGKKDGLIIFAGDIFSPSAESSTTRGGHMPAIINALGVDLSVPGNHEFDFGVPQLKVLINETAFPWLLSNIIDTNTGQVPDPFKSFHIMERSGIRIGFIGLIENGWIPTITGWPQNWEWREMGEVGKALSVKLRDPAGEYNCDLIIALTHSLIPQDIQCARELLALSPEAQKTTNIASEHGVDLLLGGHDHTYWISKGVTEWDGYDLNKPWKDAADDRGDVLIVKSGTDFQDLSEVEVTLVDAPAGSIRKKIIQAVKGHRHVTRESMAAHPQVQAVVTKELETINASWKEPVCIIEVDLDVRAITIRNDESPISNWIADCLRHAYDQALVKLGYTTTDGLIFNTGCYRGRKIYEAGTTMTIKDIMAILPNMDPAVVVELTGNEIWDTLEWGFSGWPKKGGFPSVSGLRITWDSSKPAGQRVVGVWLLAESDKIGADGKPVLVDKEEISRSSTRKYLIMTAEYMTQGGDGFDCLMNKKLIIPGEHGQPKASLLRKFLLGAQQLNKRSLTTESKPGSIVKQGLDLLKQPVANLPISNSSGIQLPNLLHSGLSLGIDAALLGASALIKVVTAPLFLAAIVVAEFEDLGLLDGYARQRARELLAARRARSQAQSGAQQPRLGLPTFGLLRPSAPSEVDQEQARIDQEEKIAQKSLSKVHPVVDGRIKNLAPPSS